MTKNRIPIPPETTAKVLFASDYTCCCCWERGRQVQIHHIDQNPGNNDVANLSVLCLLCHNDAHITGGVARKLNAELVIQYRDDWVTRVSNRRDKADELAALRMAGVSERIPTTEDEAEAWMVPADEALVAYVNRLPAVRAKAYELARPRWDTGITAES